MSNWNKSGIHGWRHKHNREVRVFIRVNANPARPEKYQVFHNHPGPRGGAIAQPFEYARDMKSAMKKAKVHLRHWDDKRKWPK